MNIVGMVAMFWLTMYAILAIYLIPPVVAILYATAHLIQSFA